MGRDTAYPQAHACIDISYDEGATWHPEVWTGYYGRYTDSVLVPNNLNPYLLVVQGGASNPGVANTINFYTVPLSQLSESKGYHGII